AAVVAAPGTPDDRFVAMLIRPQPEQRLSAIPERSTFSTVTESTPARPNTFDTKRSDGWVPSTLRPLEPLSSDTQQPSRSAAQPPRPADRQSDQPARQTVRSIHFPGGRALQQPLQRKPLTRRYGAFRVTRFMNRSMSITARTCVPRLTTST